jgi:DNA-binding XRE family transcriptional regulator
MYSGNIVSEYRKLINLTQEQLADSINVSRQTIAMWETSKQLPSDNVAVIAERFFDIPENNLLRQLQWDRLHQRVNQLEKQFNANITVRSPNNDVSQIQDLPKRVIQSFKGITLTVTRIYKSIYWFDPELDISDMMAKNTTIFTGNPQGIKIYHIGAKLIVHYLCDNQNPKLDLSTRDIYIEDNLGNHYKSVVSGCIGGESAVAFPCPPPEATLFNLHFDVINNNEDECDVLLFKDVPINGEGITKKINDDIITYNGIHWHDSESSLPNTYQIHLDHNFDREVRHLGISVIVDNLGNKYERIGSHWGYNEDKDVFYENYGSSMLDPNATTISFKYIITKEILTFDLGKLPLP